MSHIYQSLEGELIKIIVKRLNNGKTDILEWQQQALADLRLFNAETVKEIAKAANLSEQQVNEMFSEVGTKIIKDVDRQIALPTLDMPTNLDNIMRAYHDQVWSEIDNYVNQTLVSTNYGYGSATTQMYTEIVSKTTAAFNSGIYTMEQALERTIQQWAQKGMMSTFVDKGGHTWSMERYTRTVLKSTLANTYNELRTSRMGEYGVHTVLVTSHMGAREACSRIQGHVVDNRPLDQVSSDSKYRSLYDSYWRARYGEAGGHRGVNCQHEWIPFIPGVNTNNQPEYDAKENEQVAKLRQKQRELERRIVKFKKNKAVSEAMGNPENAQEWQRKITANQKRIRELVNSNEYLSRNYAREKVYTPLNTLLKDFRYDDF